MSLFSVNSGRSGKVQVLSIKIGLFSLSKGPIKDKYKCKYFDIKYVFYMFC